MSDMDELMERCMNKPPREIELEARCTELTNAVEQFRDAHDKAQIENEQLRKKLDKTEKECAYLRGIQETVEVIFGRTFGRM